MKKITQFALLGTLLFPLTLTAKGNFNLLPSAMVFPSVTGILFPNLTTAGGVNAAALPMAGKATAIQMAYSRAGANAPEGYFGGAAFTSKKFGLNLGYLGNKVGNTIYHNSFAGAGFSIEPVSVGINLRSFDFGGSRSNSVDLGLIAGEGKGLTFGFVIYNLNSHAQLDAGIGFGGNKKYNMELNLLLPAFSGGGSDYALTAAGTISPVDAFSVHFKTTYFSAGKDYQHVLGTTVFLSQVVGVLFQFATPNTWTGGVNLTF